VRRSEVVVRPYREGERFYPKGVHRHISLVRSHTAATVLVERPPQRPLRLVRRPDPLPRPRLVVVRREEPSRTLGWSILGLAIAVGMLVASLLA
jgi:hypothetical protein